MMALCSCHCLFGARTSLQKGRMGVSEGRPLWRRMKGSSHVSTARDYIRRRHIAIALSMFAVSLSLSALPWLTAPLYIRPRRLQIYVHSRAHPGDDTHFRSRPARSNLRMRVADHGRGESSPSVSR